MLSLFLRCIALAAFAVVSYREAIPDHIDRPHDNTPAAAPFGLPPYAPYAPHSEETEYRAQSVLNLIPEVAPATALLPFVENPTATALPIRRPHTIAALDHGGGRKAGWMASSAS